MNPIISEFKTSAEKIILSLKEDLKGIRTGRANPGMIEGIVVEAYGGSTKLKLMELATIVVDAPGQLSVTPFDPSTVTDIEKAILKSPLGISPQTQGNRILVKIPPLSEEQREKMTKVISQKVEEKKGHIRNQRDEARKKIKNLLEAKEITEDEKFRYEKDIDTATQKITEDVLEVKSKKEQEIMEV